RLTVELFSTWWDHHQGQPMTGAKLAEPVVALIDPHGRGRQYIATRLAQMDGTRAGGFVLTRQPPAGKWTAATYALTQTVSDATDDIGHRTHRGHRDEGAASESPIPPMGPMPYAGDDAGEKDGEL